MLSGLYQKKNLIILFTYIPQLIRNINRDGLENDSMVTMKQSFKNFAVYETRTKVLHGFRKDETKKGHENKKIGIYGHMGNGSLTLF